MAQAYQTFFFFEIKIDISTISGRGPPVIQKQNSGHVLPLSTVEPVPSDFTPALYRVVGGGTTDGPLLCL